MTNSQAAFLDKQEEHVFLFSVKTVLYRMPVLIYWTRAGQNGALVMASINGTPTANEQQMNVSYIWVSYEDAKSEMQVFVNLDGGDPARLRFRIVNTSNSLAICVAVTISVTGAQI